MHSLETTLSAGEALEFDRVFARFVREHSVDGFSLVSRQADDGRELRSIGFQSKEGLRAFERVLQQPARGAAPRR